MAYDIRQKVAGSLIQAAGSLAGPIGRVSCTDL